MYSEHPEDPTKTLLRQEAIVTVQGVPLTDYMESILTSKISANAGKVSKRGELGGRGRGSAPWNRFCDFRLAFPVSAPKPNRIPSLSECNK